MEFSLDNPGFSDSVTSVQDAPKSSGSSSASSGQPQRSCAKCPSRMSSIDRHKHLICMRCRGYECSVDLRCEGWSKEEMLVHEKFRKSLASKSKGRGKSSTKVTKKPASPLSTSANVDLDNRFAAQYDSMIKEMDDRMELLSSSLLHQIRSNNPYSEDTSAFPGQAGVQTVPEPPQPHDKSASVRSRKRLVCEGGTGAQASGLAQAQGSNVKNLPKSKIVQPPGFQGGFQDVPSGSGGPRGRREHRFDEDDYVDDKNSLAEAPLDRAFARLVDIYMSGFRIRSLRQRLRQLHAANTRAIFLLRIRLSLHANLCVYIRGSQKFKLLVVNMRLTYRVKVACFSEFCQ